MQEAIPYKSWQPLYTKTTPQHTSLGMKKGTKRNMKVMVSENAVIVLGRRGCCMCHVVKRLLLGLGANPAVYEIDEEDETRVLAELELVNGNDKTVAFPAVYIGGKLFGGLDRIIATHITGELVPVLKEAGALWL